MLATGTPELRFGGGWWWVHCVVCVSLLCFERFPTLKLKILSLKPRVGGNQRTQITSPDRTRPTVGSSLWRQKLKVFPPESVTSGTPVGQIFWVKVQQRWGNPNMGMRKISLSHMMCFNIQTFWCWTWPFRQYHSTPELSWGNSYAVCLD